MADAMFTAIFKGPHGDTVVAEDPKLAAYKQMAFNVTRGYRNRLIVNEDGTYTVQAFKPAGGALADITFALDAGG